MPAQRHPASAPSAPAGEERARALDAGPPSRRGAAAFVLLSLGVGVLFVVWPDLDLRFQELFYRPGEGFFLKDTLFARFFYEGIKALTPVLAGALAVLLGLSFHPRLRARGLHPRVPVFLLLTLALGPGLVVNVVFKDHWGRARPSQVTEFGGERRFTPAFVISDQCERNCSFVAGHPSILFAFFAPALLLRRRRRAAMAAVAAAGALAGLGRIMQGAHFLSDVIFSGVFTFLVAWLVYRFTMRAPPRARSLSAAAAPRARLSSPGLHAAALVAVAVLAWIGVAYVDRPLALWLKSYDETLLRDVFGVITELGVSAYYLVGALALYALFAALARRRPAGAVRDRLRAHARRALFVFVAVAGPSLVTSVLKIVIGRARPRLFFRDDVYGFFPVNLDVDYWSLPSGHATTIVALAMALAYLWPRHRWLFAALAVVVAASRVIITTHYASDVVVGAYVGVVGVLVVRRLFVRRGWLG